jgi:hypothetical protein
MKLSDGIKAFSVGTADYHVVSRQGDEVVLRIDYKNNTYGLEKMSKNLDEQFRQEIADVALDLLSRKHGINFADQSK